MLCFFSNAFAQELPITPEPPPTVQYLQIGTESFRIVFPSYSIDQAESIANMLALYNSTIRFSAPSKPIDIVVNESMGTSNAFVALLPRRSVFFTQPYMSTDPSKMGSSLTWLMSISTHEMQHFEQLDRTYKSGAKGAYFLLGETGWGIVNNISQPIWFSEGEAVLTETLLTPSGRGQSFGFIGNSIALYNEYGSLNYTKSYLGSFKTNVPDHYRIGWLMTNYGYQQYGAQFWPQISRAASQSAFWFFPFERALESTTGLNFEEWHDLSVQFHLKEWRETTKDIDVSPSTTIFKDSSPFPVHFQSPTQTPKGLLIAQRGGSDRISELVVIQDDSIQTRIPVGSRNASNIGANDDWIVWDATVNHPLHSGVRYSNLFAYNQKTKKRYPLTHRSYLFAPTLNAKNQIAVVQQSRTGKSSLKVFDLNNHQKDMVPILTETLAKGTLYDPHWESTNTIIAIRREDTKGNILCRYYIDTGVWEDIGNWTWNLLSHPTSSKEWVFVVRSLPYSDDIIGIPKSGGPTRLVVHQPYGVRDPSYNSETHSLIFSKITPLGSQIESMELNPELWPEITPEETAQEISLPEHDWSPKPYYAFKGLLKPYAWTPSLNLVNADLEFNINTQDVTGRWKGDQRVLYNVNQQGVFGKTSVTATRPWPNINLASTYGRRFERDASQLPENSPVNFSLSDLPSRQWREQQVLLGFDFPISLSSSHQIRDIFFTINGGLQKADELLINGSYTNPDLDWPLGISYPIATSLQVRNFQPTATLDIFSRWGQELTIGHQRLLSSNSTLNTTDYAAVQLYMPGLFNHHHWLMYAAAEKRVGSYPIPYQTRIGRGHSIKSEQFMSLSTSYILPIGYPDLALRKIMYIKRVRAGFFADTTFTDQTDVTLGGNISIDAHIMRLPILFPIGLDIGYSPTLERPYIGPNIDLLY